MDAEPYRVDVEKYHLHRRPVSLMCFHRQPYAETCRLLSVAEDKDYGRAQLNIDLLNSIIAGQQGLREGGPHAR